MFALLALAGDIGCSAGPGLVGLISNIVQKQGSPVTLPWVSDMTELGLKTGLLIAIAFPVILLVGVLIVGKKTREAKRNALE